MRHQGPPPGWGWDQTGNVMLHEHADGLHIAPGLRDAPLYVCSKAGCTKALRVYQGGVYSEEERIAADHVEPDDLGMAIDWPGAVSLAVSP